MRQGFKVLPQFNAPPAPGRGAFDVGSRGKLDPRHAPLFPSDGLPDRFARALAQRRAVPIKEVFEAFEFFGRVRKHVRAPRLADLCGGHGLAGILFALFERRVEEVLILDKARPPSFERVLAAAADVGPWVADKVRYAHCKLQRAAPHLQGFDAMLAIHACGLRTDRCLDLALEQRARIAMMPCCYPEAHCPAPATLLQHLGGPLAFDIDRTYRLESAGYRVKWDGIPEAITPMGRILIGLPQASKP